MINQWKAEKKNLLILDAGDLLYPRVSEPVSQDQKETMNLQARAIVEAFNYMGCDAITVGDDDFALGKENLLEVLRDGRFPVVSANLLDSGSKSLLFRSSITKTINGLRIGIFGLFPPLNSADKRFEGLIAEDPIEAGRKVISELKGKADFIILISHLGYAKDLEIGKELDGINVIVGGHSGINLTYPRVIRNTVVLQVANKGRYLGRADLAITDPSLPFVNLKMKETLQKRLSQIEKRLKELDEKSVKGKKDEEIRARFLRQKAETERVLKDYEQNNKLVNRIVTLRDTIEDDPECQRILAPYLNQISQQKEGSPRSQD